MNRGSLAIDFARSRTIGASMRPRFMNRGSQASRNSAATFFNALQ